MRSRICTQILTYHVIFWWMGVDYELIFWTLCPCSDLLVIRSLDISGQRPIYFLNLHHSAYKSMGFGLCAHPRKKVVLAAFLIVIHQTIILCQNNVISMISGYFSIFVLNLHHPAYKSMGFGLCAHPRKKSSFSSFFDSNPPDYNIVPK